MEEVDNLTQDDVLELIQEFPVQPLRNRLIVTMNVDEPDGEVVLSNNSFAETQYVIAVGNHIKEFQPGQRVLLDLERMMTWEESAENAYEKVPRIKLKVVEAKGRVFAMINDGYVDAIDNREEKI